MSVSALSQRFCRVLKLAPGITKATRPIFQETNSSLARCLPHCQNAQSTFLAQERNYASKARAVKFAPTKHLDFDHSGDGEQQKDLDTKETMEMYKEVPELETAPEAVKRLFTLEFATGREKLKHRKILSYNRMEEVIGVEMSLEKQIAHMTVKIRNLIPYCLAYRKDKVAMCHLNERIQMRKKLLKYLRKMDYERFIWLLKELKLAYKPYPRYNYKISRRARRKREAREHLIAVKREKIAEYRETVLKEKENFFKHKSQVLAEIEKTIETYGLDRKFVEKAYLEETAPKESKK